MSQAAPLEMSAHEFDELRERFHQILAAHGAALWRLAGSYAPGSSDRDDLYQDICLAIWRALANFRGESSERTFVFRVAHNLAISRRWRGRPRASDLDAAAALTDPTPTPEEALHADERRRGLALAVSALPLALRQVITLSLEGLPHAEIAEVLGVSENVVAVRMHRARAALRESLGRKS